MWRHHEMPFAPPIAAIWPKLSASCLQRDGAKIEPRLVSVDRDQTNRRTLMTGPVVRNDTQIDHASSAAICEEIGHRLRINVTGAPDRLPPHMMMVVEQMAQNDCVSAILNDKSETAVN
jgi:hypothetical protein